jgi:hypothetical protein
MDLPFHSSAVAAKVVWSWEETRRESATVVNERMLLICWENGETCLRMMQN